MVGVAEMNILSKVAGSGQEGSERSIPVYEALAQAIYSLGVTACFGLMSEDTLALIVALDSLGVRFCAVRHETNAVLAAEGYASASGRLGIAIIGRGPAAANGMHGIMVAARSGSSVLVIIGDEEPERGSNAPGPDYKSYDAPAVMAAAGVRAFQAPNAQSAPYMLQAAVAAALRGAAVTLHLPTSVQNAGFCGEPVDLGPSDVRPGPASSPGRRHSVDAAIRVLGQSRRPLIVAGAGAHRSDARHSLERLAEKVGALLITSVKAKDLFAGHPFDLGLCGSFSHSIARKYVDQADCVLVFGAGLNFYTTSNGKFLPDVPIVQVDSDRSHIGRWYTADIAIVGDARIVAEQIMAAVPDRGASDKPFHDDAVRREIAAFDMGSDFEPLNTNRTLDPRTLAMQLDRMLPTVRNVVYDAGNFMMAACYIGVPGPAHFRVTSDFASMGAGFGTALGVAMARPDESTVLVVGDGGFMMTISELETVARLGLRVVIAVYNDCAYGAELHMSRIHGLAEAATVFPDIDFGPLAEALGFETATLRTLEDLEACRELLAEHRGPVLLDCKVNANVQAPFIAELVAKLEIH